MIKKLRRKFMRIAMLSVSLVLFFVILAINVLNYQGSMDNLNRTMNTLIANEGVFQREEFDDPHSDRPDIAFSPRFFTVTFRAEGDSLTFLSVRLEEFDELTVSEAVSIVASLAEEKQRKGFYDKLMYRAETLKGGETLYVFLDASIQIDQFFQYLLISVLVALSSLLIVFALIWALSKRMIRPFEENYRRQKRFITDAGHEIKTPLTIIGADVEVIELENGASEWTESLKNQVVRLHTMTKKLIYLAKMDEVVSVPEVRFSISAALNEIVNSFSPRILNENRKVETDIEENVDFVGDENSIKELFSILIDNAIKYSDPASTISVRLYRDRNLILLFENQAENIKKGNYAALFERFYRLDVTRNSATGGSGIGLSIAESIVAMHKGQIEAFSEKDGSIVFKITFREGKKLRF